MSFCTSPLSLPHRAGLSGSLLGLFLLSLAVVACGPAPDRVPQYHDYFAGVTGGAEHDSSESSNDLEQILCAGETWAAMPLRSGQRLKLEVESLGENAVLTLRGCRSSGQLEETDPPGSFRLRLIGKEEQKEIHLEIPRSGGWWTLDHEIHLEDPGSPATIRLKTDLPKGTTLYLRDFYLRHEREQAPRRKSVKAPRQVLLISIDALRADALSPYGAPTEATPNLERFAAEAQVWDPHYAAATWTKPSHASMLTGHPPDVAPSTTAVLDPNVPTLAERLRAEGFRTGGMVHDCIWLNPKFGLHRGFEDYRSELWRMPREVRETVTWIGEHRDEPFFFFLHTFEVHSDFRQLPYEAPGITQQLIEERFGVANYGCRDGRCASGRLERINKGEAEAHPNEEEILRFLYGQSVSFMDQQIGLLIDELRRASVYDNLLIVFTADHGESFFEHGELLHSFAWQEILHVPLIIKWPGGLHAGERRTTPSSSIDIVPTILVELGLPTADLPGSNLLERRRDRPIIAGTQEKVVIQENLKAIFQAGNNRLFNLEEDPREEHNLAADQPQDLARLGQLRNGFYSAYKQQRGRQLSVPPDAESQPLTKEEAERLRSLGYLGGH